MRRDGLSEHMALIPGWVLGGTFSVLGYSRQASPGYPRGNPEDTPGYPQYMPVGEYRMIDDLQDDHPVQPRKSSC